MICGGPHRAGERIPAHVRPSVYITAERLPGSALKVSGERLRGVGCELPRVGRHLLGEPCGIGQTPQQAESEYVGLLACLHILHQGARAELRHRSRVEEPAGEQARLTHVAVAPELLGKHLAVYGDPPGYLGKLRDVEPSVGSVSAMTPLRRARNFCFMACVVMRNQ